MASKTELRKSRYAELRSIGYAPIEARRLRDWQGSRIQEHINDRRASIETIPYHRRTTDQQSSVKAIRAYHAKQTKAPDRAIGLTTRRDRLNQFKQWSKKRDFPPDKLQWIIRENQARHKPPLASYGFRLFYHRYVDGIGSIEARRLVERRDT